MCYDFSEGIWSMEGLQYAYSCRFDQDSKFIQREDCIENPPDTTMDDKYGYSYITLATDKKLYVRDEHIYPEFYLGITGCEGACRFYDMEIKQL